MDLCRIVKPRNAARGAQDIGHQRPATRPGFGQGERRRSPLIQPCLCQPQADHFAKHLADFGGGGEIARRAERIARAVIAQRRVQQAFGHILGHRDRAGCGDAPDQLGLEIAHAAALRRA